MKTALLISTIDSGIDRIPAMLMEPHEGLVYIICHQYTADGYPVPAQLTARADVTISRMRGKGVARSRNRVLDLCLPDVDVAIFTDDDGKYRFSDIESIQAAFRDNPKMDIGCFMIRTYPNEPAYNANYPVERTMITDTYRLSVATPEMALRPGKIKKAGIRFDELFGAGAGFLQFADENIFIADAIKAGLGVFFVPEYIVTIPYENTIKKMATYDARKVRALGGMDARVKGVFTAYIKALWFTVYYSLRIVSAGSNPLRYLYDRVSGINYFIRKRGGS